MGAILLALAFFALGNVLLALTAGLLHAAGKGGSALMAPLASRKAKAMFSGTLCREVVILSRIPAAVMAYGGLSPGIPPRASSLPCCSPAA